MKVPAGITTLHLSQKSALLLLLATGLLGVGGYDYIQQSQAVNSAVTVQATITDAHVYPLEGGRGTDYEPEIRYTYQYQEETYTSDSVGDSRTRSRQVRSGSRVGSSRYSEPKTAV